MKDTMLEFLMPVAELSSLDPISYQYFYQLLKNRTIVLNDEIEESIVEKVILPLLTFEGDDDDAPVTLILNTVGGAIGDGLPLLSIIDNYRKKLNIYVLGYAYSMGTIILCAGNNNPNVMKYCHKFSTGLFHGGYLSISNNASQARDTYEFFLRQNDKVRSYILTNTKVSPEQYDRSVREEWYLSAEEMKELGLVDVIL